MQANEDAGDATLAAARVVPEKVQLMAETHPESVWASEQQRARFCTS